MRQVLLLSVLLLGVSWLAAQNTASPGQKDSSQTAASAGSQTTVEGCLSGSDGKYTLTDQSGKTYELTGDTSKLAEHIGHEVKVTGNTSASGAMSGSAPASGTNPSAGSASASAGQSLEVSSVKHVSKSCKNSGGGMSH